MWFTNVITAADYHGVEGMRDTDQVITTRELARWAKSVHYPIL